jgi:hypothetical protein
MVLDCHRTTLENYIILNTDHGVIQVVKNHYLEQLL